jgi:hypothetical protein
MNLRLPESGLIPGEPEVTSARADTWRTWGLPEPGLITNEPEVTRARADTW